MLKRINLTLLTVAIILGLLDGGYFLYTKLHNSKTVQTINSELGGN